MTMDGTIKSLFSSKGANIESLKLSHSGKRILLEAKNIYDRGRVPHGEEEYLFLYRISNINENGTTAVIEYEGKFVVKGGDMFQSYPDVWGNDSIIEDYSLRTLKDDHELYNQHLGRVNRVINDKKEEQLKQEKLQKINSLDDVSDLDRKFWEDKMNCYQLLLGEFHPVPGEGMKEHRITKGANCGKTKYKQQWSQYFVLL